MLPSHVHDRLTDDGSGSPDLTPFAIGRNNCDDARSDAAPSARRERSPRCSRATSERHVHSATVARPRARSFGRLRRGRIRSPRRSNRADPSSVTPLVLDVDICQSRTSEWPVIRSDRLVQELSRLPGIGEKTATRLAFHLVRGQRQHVHDLAQALVDVTDKIRLCSVCMNMTEQDPCALCNDPQREAETICVVATPVGPDRDRSRRPLPRPLPRAARPAVTARGHRPG